MLFENKYLVGTLVSLTTIVVIGFFCANVILKQWINASLGKTPS